jgi:hypothetical protein
MYREQRRERHHHRHESRCELELAVDELREILRNPPVGVVGIAAGKSAS